jgi:hypothetical protein
VRLIWHASFGSSVLRQGLSDYIALYSFSQVTNLVPKQMNA